MSSPSIALARVRYLALCHRPSLRDTRRQTRGARTTQISGTTRRATTAMTKLVWGWSAARSTVAAAPLPIALSRADAWARSVEVVDGGTEGGTEGKVCGG